MAPVHISSLLGYSERHKRMSNLLPSKKVFMESQRRVGRNSLMKMMSQFSIGNTIKDLVHQLIILVKSNR